MILLGYRINIVTANIFKSSQHARFTLKNKKKVIWDELFFDLFQIIYVVFFFK